MVNIEVLKHIEIIVNCLELTSKDRRGSYLLLIKYKLLSLLSTPENTLHSAIIISAGKGSSESSSPIETK